MKKLFLTIVVLLAIICLAWQFRVDLLVWGAPKIRAFLDPVPDNIPTQWSKGPDVASLPPGERAPNIILILADDLGFNDISLYNGGAGDGSLKTPGIDQIAEQGITFTNGYAANAICAPSRASMLTGRYSTRFGFEFTPIFKLGPTIMQWMQDQDDPALPILIDHKKAQELPDMAMLGMPSEEITIAEVLQQANYYTAHIGKWHLGAAKGMRPEDQGFDDSLYMAGTLYLPEDHKDVVNAKRSTDSVDRMLWAAGRYAVQFNGGELFQPDAYLTDYFTNEAIKVISNNQHRPFFLYLAHWAVHNPLQALKNDYDTFPHIESHNLRVYSAMIRALNRSVEKIQQVLEDKGLADNTLIIFTSDNGGAGYLGLPDINKPFRGWKLTHFEGGTHVPFMASWPARIKAGSKMHDPVHHVDLFHTFAGAAGGKVHFKRKLDGANLLPFISGERSGKPHQTLFWREGYHQAVLHKGWKLIRSKNPEKKWLFNLARDPTEQNNLALAHPEMVVELESLLSKHNAEQATPLWPSVIQAPQLIDKTGAQSYTMGDEYIYWPN